MLNSKWREDKMSSTVNSHVDIFSKYGISRQEGHVTLLKDQKIKSTVYQILAPPTGSSSADDPQSHYIQLSNLNQSGRYLYILFRPIPRLYFIFKLQTIPTAADEAADSSKRRNLHISVSNLINQLRLTASSIDIPYYFTDVATPTPNDSSWTCLALDLRAISARYFTCNHGYLDTLQLCANVLIKGVYVSDILYRPPTVPFPADMRLPVPQGLCFEDIYQYKLLPKDHISSDRRQRSITVHSVTESAVTAGPFIKLRKVIGMNINSNQQMIFSSLGSRVFFACQSIVVAMETSSKEQQFYIGHTDKVTCIALSGDDLKLASAQTNLGGVVRLWDVSSGSCLAILHSSHQSISLLSLSFSGDLLCSVGRHDSGKTLIAVWKGTEQRVKSLTDVDIKVLRIAPFDSSRMVSCGWNNLRFWRIKDDILKSSPVALRDYHQTLFTDVQFESPHHLMTNRHVYASTADGCIMEVEYHSFSVKRVWQLFPESPGGVAITSLALHEGFCVTGSSDGFVRLWPVNYEHVTMETDHGSPIMLVGVAKDGLLIMTATTGSIGLLDSDSKSYKTILRTHTDTVTGMGLSPCSGQWLVSVSDDSTVRVWDKSCLEQVYEFTNEDGDTPTAVDIHPVTNDIGVGYKSGAVRFISLMTGAILSEHIHDQSSVNSLVFTPDGRRGFSSDSKGTLALYDTTHQAYPLLKLLGNTVAVGGSLIVSESMLAFIGPLPSLVTLYSIQSLEQVMCFDTAIRSRDSELPMNLCFSCDVIGHMIVLTNQNRLFKYSIKNGQYISEVFPVHESGHCFSIATSEQYLITGGSTGDIKVWDYHRRKGKSQSFLGHSGHVMHLRLSHDQLISSSANVICLWDVVTDRCQTPPNSIVPSTKPVHGSGWPRSTIPHPVSPPHVRGEKEEPPSVNVSSIQATPLSQTDDVIITHTPEGGVELVIPAAAVSAESATILEEGKHYRYQPPTHVKPNQLFLAPPTESALILERVIGYNNDGRNNVHWSADKGIILYTSGSIVVIEDLKTDSQTLLTAHPTEISTMSVTHDGCGLATACYTHEDWHCEIKLWDMIESSSNCYQCIKSLYHHEIGVSVLSYSTDDRFLLSVGDDLQLAIYSICSSAVLVTTQLSHLVHEIQWDPSIAYEFATVGVAGISFWLFDESDRLLKIHDPAMPSSMKEATALCYTGLRYLYVGDSQGTVTVWNTRDNSCHFLWKTGCPEIGAICCNDEKVIVGGADGTIQLWAVDLSVNNPNAMLDCSLDVVGGVYSLSFDPLLSMGVVGANGIYFVDWSERQCDDLHCGHHGNITGISYSSDGRVLASCDANGVTNLWSTRNHLSILLQYRTKKECTAVALADHAHLLICVCGCSDGSLLIYNITDRKLLARHRPHKSAITKLVILKRASDGAVLSGNVDGIVMATDLRTGSMLYTISAHKGNIISDMDSRVFSVGLPGIVSVNEEVSLIASEDQRISLWCRNTLFDWLTFPTNKHTPTLARFCPTEPDHIICTGGREEISLKVYSLTQKTIIKTLALNYWPTCLSLSFDGHLIAVGCNEQVLTVMDTEGTFQESSTHCHTLSSLAFSPNSQQCVSVSQNYFHIWKVQHNY